MSKKEMQEAKAGENEMACDFFSPVSEMEKARDTCHSCSKFGTTCGGRPGLLDPPRA